MSPDSVDVARLAAGSLVAMVDAIVDGPTKKGGSRYLRPPGHHARPARAMGFCLFNNVAVAAAHARPAAWSGSPSSTGTCTTATGRRKSSGTTGVLYVSTHQFPSIRARDEAEEIGEGEGRATPSTCRSRPAGGDAVYASAFERSSSRCLERTPRSSCS